MNGASNTFFYLGWICVIHLGIFALILLLKRSNAPANRTLALFMLIFGGVHIDDILIFSGLAWKYHTVNELIHFLFFFLGPLYLRYTSLMTGIPVNWNARIWLHLLPFGFALAYVVYLSWIPPDRIREFYTLMVTSPPLLGSLMNFITALQMGIYLIWSLRLIRRYNRRMLEKRYYAELNLRWLETLTIWLLLVCYVIVPPLLAIANRHTLIFYAFQPVMTTVIYLLLLYCSVNFPGQAYEQHLIREEERELIRRDMHDEIEAGIDHIRRLSESAKLTTPGAGKNLEEISGHAVRLVHSLRRFLNDLQLRKD